MEEYLRTTPIWNVFVLFLIIASNYIGELFPCRVQDLLGSNIYLKHFIAFLTLLFFVVVTDSTANYKSNEVMLISVKLYFIFLILINTNRQFFLYCLIILATTYIIKLLLKDYEDNIDNVDEDIQYQRLKIIEKTLFIIFFITLITGFIVYMGEKKIEYKNKFNYSTFIFGKPSCKSESPNSNIVKSFISAFK